MKPSWPRLARCYSDPPAARCWPRSWWYACWEAWQHSYYPRLACIMRWRAMVFFFTRWLVFIPALTRQPGLLRFQGIMASLLVGFGSFQQIIAYFIFPAVLFLGLTVAGLFALRQTNSRVNAKKGFGFPWTPLVFLALVAALLGLLAMHNPKQVMLGCAVVALGVPAYQLCRHREESTGRP